LNGEAASLMMQEPKAYESKVKKYICKFASPEKWEQDLSGMLDPSASTVMRTPPFGRYDAISTTIKTFTCTFNPSYSAIVSDCTLYFGAGNE